MIKINLVIRPRPTDWRHVGAVAAIIVSVLGACWHGATWVREYRAVVAEQASVEALAQSLQSTVGRGPEVTAAHGRAQAEAGAVAQLTRNQGARAQSDRLRAILAAVPGEATLERIAVQADGSVLITGRSSAFSAVGAFVDALRRGRPRETVRPQRADLTPGGEWLFTVILGGERGVAR